LGNEPWQVFLNPFEASRSLYVPCRLLVYVLFSPRESCPTLSLPMVLGGCLPTKQQDVASKSQARAVPALLTSKQPTSCRVSVLDSRSILGGSTEALEIRLCGSCWCYAVRGGEEESRRRSLFGRGGCPAVWIRWEVGYAIVFHVLTTIVNRESVGRCRRRCQCPFRRRRRVSMSWWIRSDR
jgi:hypothetical protein